MRQWPTVEAAEALRRLQRGARALDVRSEGEFEHGFIPDFINLPILNNSQRHEVGLIYKLKGQAAAITLGLELTASLKTALVDGWRRTLAPASEDMRLLLCWRGGLRSKVAAEWLAETEMAGQRVQGGYKALRGELLNALENPPEFCVLGGLTGVGKSEVLTALREKAVLDLEALANHRGSSFGLRYKTLQPGQQTFENAIGLAFFDGPRLMAVENESRLIGRCSIPTLVKARMDQGTMVVLEDTYEGRLKRIYAEYVLEPLRTATAVEVFNHLAAALERVQRRLGGLRYQRIRSELQAAFQPAEPNFDAHMPWLDSLLRDYYDPMYEYCRQNDARRVIFQGDAAAVRAFLAEHLSPRAPGLSLQ